MSAASLLTTMTRKEELWKLYTDRNPSFLQEDGTVTMTTAGLKKFFDQTFDSAFDAGKAASEALRKLAGNSGSPFDSLFKR